MLREKFLEPLGMIPMVNAARRNFHVSQMQRQMSRGAKGYLLHDGVSASQEDQVSSLEQCSKNDVCTVGEQRDFYKGWLASLRQ
jgi:hypothetical protein